MAHGSQIVLQAFAPSRDSYDAKTLTYKNLSSFQQRYGPIAFIKNSPHLLRSSLNSIDDVKTQLNVATIINASYRLQRSLTPVDRFVWSLIFTRSSIKLFGKPQKNHVAQLAAAELVSMSREYTDFAAPLIETYQTLTTKKTKRSTSLEEKYAELLTSIALYFETTYRPAFQCIEKSTLSYFHPHDIASVFAEAIHCLAAKDSSWSQWSVVLDNSASLSVRPAKKQIRVGAYRSPISKKDIKGLFAHEVLVHAQRAVNGTKISKKMATGTSDYLTAEEGLGVLVEAAINHSIPEKIKDRYIDVALALGDKLRKPLTREELFSVCYRRAVLRSLKSGLDPKLDVIEAQTWEHVNRIYRGSLGNNYIGVLTKDIAYYQGFIRMARHFDAARKRRRLPSQLKYALQGKFDPTSRQ